jgi:hypothetical protein
MSNVPKIKVCEENPDGPRTCGKCARTKCRRDFGPRRLSSDGLDTICRECIAKYKRDTWASMPQHKRTAILQSESQRKMAAGPARDARLAQKRAVKLRYKYGIEPDDFQHMADAQRVACAICKTVPPPTDRVQLVVDHDHDSDVVRGLLCWKCNAGLGMFKEDVDVLLRAVEYIRRRR